uniref:Metalloendopeptidase n=1 Tax=Scleropages formosus TaxID=113540 RepID=A0A8C9R2J9_SCLFO
QGVHPCTVGMCGVWMLGTLVSSHGQKSYTIQTELVTPVPALLLQVCGGDGPTVVGDVAVSAQRNADPCTSRGCLWPKYSDGKVYMPYVIANHYSSLELSVIQRALESFSASICIRFNLLMGICAFLSNGQVVSLSRQGCIYHGTVQHELLHALGFNHEQTRSDCDNHILPSWHNFNRIQTKNLDTPYDYNSVMQYHRYAFSKNNQPTMVPIPNSNVEIGMATQMSANDILRVKRLYKC